MKVSHLKAHNVLSFGDYETNLHFDMNNVIAGPNDSGKTNIFRALNLIEDAFDYNRPPLDEILFQGDSDRSFSLEVEVQMDPTEIELITTQTLCSELLTVVQQQDTTHGIKDNKMWKNILTEYGSAIISKSFRTIAFLLTKDELSTSEPKMVVRFADGGNDIYMTQHSYLSGHIEEPGSQQRLSLAKIMFDDFQSRFSRLAEADLNSLIQDVGKLSQLSPSLVSLLDGKLGGNPYKMVALGGGRFEEYRNVLKGEPIVAKLSRLCSQYELENQNLYIWSILRQIYRTALIWLQELRTSPPVAASSSDERSKEPIMLGSDLALRLFRLRNSSSPTNRKKYEQIKEKFRKWTNTEFDIAVRTREVTMDSEGELGVVYKQGSVSEFVGSQTTFSPLGTSRETKNKLMHEAFIQVVKNNYPISIERAASGLYEILFLLTTIIGETGKVLLLDEPELHLHPSMQKRIASLIADLSAKNENQVLMITHSPYFIQWPIADTTWRLTRTEKGTEAHNLGGVLSELKLADTVQRLSSTDIRALLFCRGVILVEGIKDKIALELLDSYLSRKGQGVGLEEAEWSVIDMGGKGSLAIFLSLAQKLGVSRLAIVDRDALMQKEQHNTIKINGLKLRTSSVLFALLQQEDQRSTIIKEIDHNILQSNGLDRYDSSIFEDLRGQAAKHGIFVLPKDLEGLLNAPKKAIVDKVLEIINEGKDVSEEFREMCRFISEQIKRIEEVY